MNGKSAPTGVTAWRCGGSAENVEPSGGSVEERLKRVLGEVFEMEEGEIDSDSSQENVVFWDSLHHLKMITELEAVFEVRFSMREIRSMTTFPKIKEILSFHLDGMKSRPDGGE